MSVGVSQIIDQIRALNEIERAELLDWMKHEAEPMRHHFPISPEMNWLKRHSAEYAGEWVAIRNEELIAHDKDHRVVFAAARAVGLPLPLVTLVEPPTQAFWGGWA